MHLVQALAHLRGQTRDQAVVQVRGHPCRFAAYLARHLLLLALVAMFAAGCARKPDPNTLVMEIESSPTNLDPRVGVDAQSERIDNLIFDDLLSRLGMAERREDALRLISTDRATFAAEFAATRVKPGWRCT